MSRGSGPPPGVDGVCRWRGRAVLSVSLVPRCAWCAGLEDGSEGGALGLGEGWGLGDQVLNVCGEGVGDGGWRRDWLCCGVVLTGGGAGGWGGYGRVVGTSPPSGRGRGGKHA